MTLATGVGSWPGTDMAEALAVVRGELAEDLPFLPELPGRGPGADLVGRGASLLVDLPVDLQPSGWRLVDRPGRDLARARAMLREDLDRTAEALDGWSGPLKVQVVGPWTALASLQLTRGERAVSDPGACREVVQSLAEGVAAHLRDVARAVPGATPVLQLDEPSLPAVLAGRLPTASGYGRLRAVQEQEVREGLAAVLAAGSGAPTVVHCCAAEPPVALLAGAGAGAVSVDLGLLRTREVDDLAAAVEGGTRLYAGVVPTTGDLPGVDRLVEAVVGPWHRVGLPVVGLADVVVTPTCGLAGATPARARAALDAARRVARQLAERAAE